MIAAVQLRREPAYRREAFEKGLKRLGYSVVTNPRDVPRPNGPQDLLVVWNLKRGVDELDAKLWEQRGGTVIVTENAYLQKIDKSSYAISTHGHCGSGWFPVDPAGHRFSALGYNLKPMREMKTGYVLICDQRGIGSTLMASPPSWGAKMLQKVQGGSGLVAKLRPHPGNFAPKVPLLTDLAGAHTCRIWSSSAGVVALIEGVHTIHSAPHWVCENWQVVGREVALNRMAHGQWSVAEIESGEPFARMQAHNWGPREWR